MKIVGQILLACILLALLRYVVIAALVLLFTGLLWGALFRPQETFGLLAMLLVSGLVGGHPVACLVVAGLAFVAIKLGKHYRAGTPRTGRSESPSLALLGQARKAAAGDFGAGDA
jgi:hypothetical protein